MKLRRLFFLSAVATALMSQAVEPAAQLFAAMPDSLIPSLEVNRRKDLIDLFHAGQSAQVTTKLGGKAQMTELQEQSLVIALSEQSQMALHLYTTHDNDTLVALVNTVYAPAGDSRIRFFDSAWRELPASKYIEQPTRDDFFLFPDTLRVRWLDMRQPVVGEVSRPRNLQPPQALPARVDYPALERETV